MVKRFSTIPELVAAGYVPAKDFPSELYRGFKLRSLPQVGDSYILTLDNTRTGDRGMVAQGHELARSEKVWMTDEQTATQLKLDLHGYYLQVFSPEAIEVARRETRKRVDAYLDERSDGTRTDAERNRTYRQRNKLVTGPRLPQDVSNLLGELAAARGESKLDTVVNLIQVAHRKLKSKR